MSKKKPKGIPSKVEEKMKRITIKIGTKVLTDSHNNIDKVAIKALADQICTLMDRKIEVVLVSSGAIAAGLGLLDVKRKNQSLSELQAIASIGQNHLMDIYNMHFSKRGYIAGQILLTQEDFNDRKRSLNLRYTLNSLFGYNSIPVINENDSISTEEIKCGDNDRLSSLVADFSDSDMLMILTDVDGLCDKDNNVIKTVEAITGDIRSLCRGKGCEESTGGMLTKLEALKNVSQAGIKSVIARGKRKDVILDIVEGKDVGTRVEAGKRSLKARKRWIAFSVKPKGSIVIDDGAEKALVNRHKSLLASGVVDVSGNFSEGDVIDVLASGGGVIARGLINYSSREMNKIKGLRSDKIEKELGYKDYDEVIHRDNLVIIAEE